MQIHDFQFKSSEMDEVTIGIGSKYEDSGSLNDFYLSTYNVQRN